MKSYGTIICDGVILLLASTAFVFFVNGVFSLLFGEADSSNPLTSNIVTLSAKTEGTEEEGTEMEGSLSLEEQNKEIQELLNAKNGEKKVDYIAMKDNHDHTPLMMTCYINYNDPKETADTDSRRLPYVNLLIKNGAEVNETDKDGWTPLFWASWSGMNKCANKLIQSGAAVNIADRQGNTPLILAAMKGHPETVELLLKNKADCTAKGYQGRTALEWAIDSFDKLSKETLIKTSKDSDNLKRLEQTIALLKQTK